MFGDALQKAVELMVTSLSPFMRHDWALLQCSQGNSSTDFIWGICRTRRLRTRPHQPSRKSVFWQAFFGDSKEGKYNPSRETTRLFPRDKKATILLLRCCRLGDGGRERF